MAPAKGGSPLAREGKDPAIGNLFDLLTDANAVGAHASGEPLRRLMLKAAQATVAWGLRYPAIHKQPGTIMSVG